MKITLQHFYKNIIAFDMCDPFSKDLQISNEGKYSSFYSPFEFINEKAKVVLIGISPGATQAINANTAAKIALENGKTTEDAVRIAKNVASFSGALRNNLIKELNYIGLHKYLGINDCEHLFTTTASHLVHYTSVFRYPVIKDCKPISTAKGAMRSEYLSEIVRTYLVEEVEKLENAIWIPLGQGVEEVLLHLASEGLLNKRQILVGLPHPSGANAERIKYFLGTKPKELLSKKTNAEKIDLARNRLLQQIEYLI
ncbi:MAG: hypothetical protein ACI9LM_005204 [Alteromonadaceae bacterium]|jgi:hypothetical protein